MASDTLRVRHLPLQLSNTRRDELFKRYGSTKTKTVRYRNNDSVTYVLFPSKEAANDAFLQLHQLQVKGRYLSIEFAQKSIADDLEEETLDVEPEVISNEAKNEQVDNKHYQTFMKKLNNWAGNDLLSQPPPPNMWYKYSCPTRNTLHRIAIQLIQEPAFYTQVLHLMNKMNLPPPFEELDEEFPMLREIYDMEKYKDIFGIVDNDRDEQFYPHTEVDNIEDDEESEIDSDSDNNGIQLVNIPVKRAKPQSSKRLKIPKFVNPTKQVTITMTSSAQKSLRTEDMFESVQQRSETKKRKIELKPIEKLDTEIKEPEAGSANAPEAGTGFGIMTSINKKTEDENADPENQESKKSAERDCITTEELEENRISTNDQRLYPVYNDYHPGKPNCRLYIKNLARQVEDKDLHYIYRRYVNPNLKNAENEYSLRLMQEGKLRGQAFVTFQNVGQATLALNETNGYLLKDKPMVVQFGRAPKS